MARDVVQGSQPHGVVDDASFPLKIGGLASSTRPTAVDSGDRVGADFDTFGALASTDGGPRQTVTMGLTSQARFTSADQSSAAADVTAAPTSGQKLVILDIDVSVDTAMRVDLKEETAGTVFKSWYMAANSVIQYTPRGKWKLNTADKKLQVQTSASGNVSVSVTYYSEA